VGDHGAAEVNLVMQHKQWRKLYYLRY